MEVLILVLASFVLLMFLLVKMAGTLSPSDLQNDGSAPTKESEKRKARELKLITTSDIGTPNFEAHFDWDSYWYDIRSGVSFRERRRRYSRYVDSGGYRFTSAQAAERERLHKEALAAKERRKAIDNICGSSNASIRNRLYENDLASLDYPGLIALDRDVSAIIEGAESRCRDQGDSFKLEKKQALLVSKLKKKIASSERSIEAINAQTNRRVQEISGEVLSDSSFGSIELASAYADMNAVIVEANEEHRAAKTGQVIKPLPAEPADYTPVDDGVFEKETRASICALRDRYRAKREAERVVKALAEREAQLAEERLEQERTRLREDINARASSRIIEIANAALSDPSLGSAELTSAYAGTSAVVAEANVEHEAASTGQATAFLPPDPDASFDVDGMLSEDAHDAIRSLRSAYRAKHESEQAEKARAEKKEAQLAEEHRLREMVNASISEWSEWAPDALASRAARLRLPSDNVTQAAIEAFGIVDSFDNDRACQLEEECRSSIEPLGFRGVTLAADGDGLFELRALLEAGDGPLDSDVHCTMWFRPFSQGEATHALDACTIVLKAYAQGAFPHIERILSSHYQESTISAENGKSAGEASTVWGHVSSDGLAYGIAGVFAPMPDVEPAALALATSIVKERRSLEESVRWSLMASPSLPFSFEGIVLDTFEKTVKASVLEQALVRALVAWNHTDWDVPETSMRTLLACQGFASIEALPSGEDSMRMLVRYKGIDWALETPKLPAPNGPTLDAPAHPEPTAAEPISATVDFDSLEGHEFERFCADLLRKAGYADVEVTQGSGDQGIDVIAWHDGVKYGVQCKRYSTDVGNKAVQEALAGKAYHGCHVAVVLTNQHFTQSAIDLARSTGVVLWDRGKLLKLARSAV